MITAQDMITHSLASSERVIGLYLDDLKPEAFLDRPVGGMNHLAWQVGHLISVERRTVEAVKPGSCPPLPEGFDAKHAMDQHAIDDPSHFLTKDEYLKLWRTQRAATKSVLEGLSDDDLAAPCPNEKMRAMCPTVGTMINLMGLHTLMHAGQFVATRRHQAMPIAF